MLWGVVLRRLLHKDAYQLANLPYAAWQDPDKASVLLLFNQAVTLPQGMTAREHTQRRAHDKSHLQAQKGRKVGQQAAKSGAPRRSQRAL